MFLKYSLMEVSSSNITVKCGIQQQAHSWICLTLEKQCSAIRADKVRKLSFFQSRMILYNKTRKQHTKNKKMIQMDYYCPADSVHQLDQVCHLYVFMIGLGFSGIIYSKYRCFASCYSTFINSSH